MAKTPIVVKSNATEAVPEKVGQAAPRSLDTPAVEDLVIEPASADALDGKDKLEQLKFNEDILTVVLSPTSDKTATPIVTVWNSGKPFYFKRGVAVKVARKYVEVLALAKPISYQINYGIDQGSKEAYNSAVPTVGLRHSFTVVDDPAGHRGRVWLEQLLQGA